ncbi:MAG: hypothetical protein JXB19_00915 [Bacteroidales bacterium]|nr:hypothetical protein [Bacteroidales bacterium]
MELYFIFNDSNPLRETDDHAISIYNNWTVVSRSFGTIDMYYEDFVYLKYLLIKPDNTISLLYKYDYGIRGGKEGLCQIIGGQINIFGDCLFNFTVDDNDLTLTNPDGEIILRCYGNEPSRHQWVANIELLQTMDAPVEQGTDLAFNGEFLWYGAGTNYSDPAYLYKIDPATLSVVQNLPTSNWAVGIEWADGYLWTSSNGYSSIYKVNPLTGSNVFTSVGMGLWIKGIAYDNNYLWCGSWNEKTIYKYNPFLNLVSAEFQIRCLPEGVAYVGGYLYICVDGFLNRCTTDPFQCVGAYDLANGYIYGFAFDGNDYWISAYLAEESPHYKIFKVSW